MSESENWIPCLKPVAGDILRWNEPLWAPPDKPRGKPDKIGEQQITAKLLVVGVVYELKVLGVEKLTPGAALLKVKVDDTIRRKKTTIEQGLYHKRTV